MKTYAMFMGAMLFASPALAQVATPAPQNGAPPTSAAPNTVQPATSTAPTQAAPDQAAPATTPDQSAAATPAGQPAAGAGGIAQVVDTEWTTYDTNGDGKLSETEFAAWMNKLKGASDPSLKPDSPATKKWNASAFAQADKDKSKSLTKAELTGFLSQGQS